MKSYEYKILLAKPSLALLNEHGAEGWMVIDRHHGNILMMREVE